MYEYTFQRKMVSESPIDASGPRAIMEATKGAFAGAESEMIVVAALDSANRLSGYEVVYKGNVSAALVRVGELFRLPVRLNASGMVVLHNHPSGDLAPSMDDRHLTAEAIAAGEVLDIPCLDHIIVAGNGYAYRSLRDDLHMDFGKPR